MVGVDIVWHCIDYFDYHLYSKVAVVTSKKSNNFNDLYHSKSTK